MSTRVSDFFDNTEEYEALLENASRGAQGNPVATDFVDSMIERWEEYEFNAFIFLGQVNWLKELANK